MAGSNCGERIKLGFIDLDSRIDEYHTGVVQFQRGVCHRKRMTETQFRHDKGIFTPMLYSWLHQKPFSTIFRAPDVNSICDKTE